MINEEAAYEIKNYFNYFTEVEEHFRVVRGTGLFMMGSVDWALVEAWKNAGIPLEAVLRGIDATFEKWRSRKIRTQMINAVGYCAQAVAHEAQVIAGTARGSSKHANDAPPFTMDEVRDFVTKNAGTLKKAGFDEIASKLERIVEDLESEYAELESLEQTLTALEDKLIAIQRAKITDDELIAARRELDLQLRPYRSKMSAEQLAMLEKQYLDRRLLERADIPRLSLFYLH